MAHCHGGPWAPAPPRAQHLAVLSTLLLLAPHRAQPLDRLSTSPCTAASHCTRHLNTLSISPRSAPHRAQRLAMFSTSPRSAPCCAQHLDTLSTSPAQHLAVLRCSSLQNGVGVEGDWRTGFVGLPGLSSSSRMSDACWFPQNATIPRLPVMVFTCAPRNCSVQPCFPVLRTKPKLSPLLS